MLSGRIYCNKGASAEECCNLIIFYPARADVLLTNESKMQQASPALHLNAGDFGGHQRK